MSADPQEEYIKLIEAENDVLRGRVAELEAMLGVTFAAPPILGLTAHEAGLFGFLLRRDFVTKQAALSALYGGMDEPEIKIIDVFICKLRKKIAPFGIRVETQWGQGYWMDAASKARALQMMPEKVAA